MKWKHEKLTVPVVVLVIGLAAYPVKADMIAFWEFDYGSADDSWGENHGRLNGYVDWATGHRGKGLALKLDGSGYVSIDNESNFDISDEITVACWIKVKAFDQEWQAIVTKGDESWRLDRTSVNNTVKFHCNGIKLKNDIPGLIRNLGPEGNMNVNDSQWHHIAGIYNGSNIYLYVDGVLDTSLEATGSILTDHQRVYIGENAQQTGRGFKGLIDEVAIFDNALNEDEIEQLYNQGAVSFIPKSYMAKLVEEAQLKIKELSPEQAVAFLENRIDEYEEWKLKNLNNIKWYDKRLSPDILYLLAKTKEAAGLPKRDVVAAYKRSVSRVSSRTNYVPVALLWLFENLAPNDYINVIHQFVLNSSVLSYNLYHVAKHFESSGNWDAFKLFLDGAFSAVDFRGQPTYSYANIIARGLKEDGVWATKFRDYCQKQPELTAYLFHEHEGIAREYITKQNFTRAAEIYRNVISQCGPYQKKMIYEFRLCECLFNAGQYDSAVNEIDSFIKRNKATNRIPILKAIMLKGHAYVHLGDADRAADTFLKLIVEYPEAKQAPEATFFIGYCHMLQGKFDEATEALNLVVKDYPNSEYAGKAGSYLDRIKNMTQ